MYNSSAICVNLVATGDTDDPVSLREVDTKVSKDKPYRMTSCSDVTGARQQQSAGVDL